MILTLFLVYFFHPLPYYFLNLGWKKVSIGIIHSSKPPTPSHCFMITLLMASSFNCYRDNLGIVSIFHPHIQVSQ